MRDGDPPFYGQPQHRHRSSQEEEAESLALLQAIKFILGKVEDIVGLIVRTIAGISITDITNEVVVFPVEIVDLNTILVKMQPTPQAQANTRYVVQLKLDFDASVTTLPLGSIEFTQLDIDARQAFTVPFDISDFDLNGVSGFIAEVFLDATISDIEVGVANATLVGGVVNHDIVMNVGSGGLTGFDIELTIEDATIAKFIGAAFSPSFPLANFLPDPVDGPVVRIRGIDLADAVNAGALNEVLATLDIEPLALGTSTITASIVALDDEVGNPIQAVINNGSIVVTA